MQEAVRTATRKSIYYALEANTVLLSISLSPSLVACGCGCKCVYVCFLGNALPVLFVKAVVFYGRPMTFGYMLISFITFIFKKNMVSIL